MNGYRVASLTGPDYGLVLYVNIEQAKYMEDGLTEVVRGIFLILN